MIEVLDVAASAAEALERGDVACVVRVKDAPPTLHVIGASSVQLAADLWAHVKRVRRGGALTLAFSGLWVIEPQEACDGE